MLVNACVPVDADREVVLDAQGGQLRDPDGVLASTEDVDVAKGPKSLGRRPRILGSGGLDGLDSVVEVPAVHEVEAAHGDGRKYRTVDELLSHRGHHLQEQKGLSVEMEPSSIINSLCSWTGLFGEMTRSFLATQG